MTAIEILKLLGWIVSGYITARVLYFKIYKDDKSDGGDKMAALITFLIWPIALGAAVIIGACYLVMRAVTWEFRSKPE